MSDGLESGILALFLHPSCETRLDFRGPAAPALPWSVWRHLFPRVRPALGHLYLSCWSACGFSETRAAKWATLPPPPWRSDTRTLTSSVWVEADMFLKKKSWLMKLKSDKNMLTLVGLWATIVLEEENRPKVVDSSFWPLPKYVVLAEK